MEDTDTRVDVREAVKRLPAGFRRIVYMRVWEDKTWDEIGADLGVSRPYVRGLWDKEIAPALRGALS